MTSWYLDIYHGTIKSRSLTSITSYTSFLYENCLYALHENSSRIRGIINYSHCLFKSSPELSLPGHLNILAHVQDYPILQTSSPLFCFLFLFCEIVPSSYGWHHGTIVFSLPTLVHFLSPSASWLFQISGFHIYGRILFHSTCVLCFIKSVTHRYSSFSSNCK